MKRVLSISVCLFIALTIVFATSPKREFRSTWLATVYGIDWPATKSSGEEAERSQKATLKTKLDLFEELGLNACFFQVRGMSDAFYNSQYEPWSQYLTGTRGLAPTYDPLEYIIEEAHKRGIEVHAWINPYRYSTGSGNHGTLKTDYSQTHPEWLIYVGSNCILNPGIPEVTRQIVRIVEDIVEHYDVDGIVFDDYFYLQDMLNSDDDEQYEKYNPDGLDRADWRRQNVNNMVAAVNAAIKSIKPWVRFGIGPAGVAASNQSVADKYGITPCPSGSDWQYNGIYSEPVQWLMDNTIDYISPQVYWTIGSSNDYSMIVPWWGMVAHKFGRHNYVSASLEDVEAVLPGRGVKELTEGDNENGLSDLEHKRAPQQTMYKPDETVNELLINYSSAKEGAPGMVFYSSKYLSTSGFVETLLDEVWTDRAIVPSLTWFKMQEQGLVSNLTLTGQTLSWNYSDGNVRYGIYAIPKSERNDYAALTTSKYYLGMSYDTEYILPAGTNANYYSIAVTVIDRYGNEFAPRFLNEEMGEKVTPVLLFPEDNASVMLPAYLKWQPVEDAMGYIVEIARDADFEDLIAVSMSDTCQLFTQLFSQIDGSSTYYWHVKANAANRESDWSETRSFGGQLFSITYPADGENEIAVTPTIKWDDAGVNSVYTLEIAVNSDFEKRNIVYSATTELTEHTIPHNTLLYGTTYYARVSGENEIMSVVSPTLMFTTKQVLMLPPVILAPVENAVVSGKSFTARVEETPNNGFQWELSETESFPRTRYIDQTDVNVFSYTFEEDLCDGEYWLRVATITADNMTDFSEVVHFTYDENAAGVEVLEEIDVYVSEGMLYAPAGTVWVIYTMEGKIAARGTTQAMTTHLPQLERGIYLLQIKQKTIKIIY